MQRTGNIKLRLYRVISNVSYLCYFQEIFVHLGSNTVVLQSESGNQYKVKYNGEEQTISEPVVFDEEQEIYAYTQRYSSEHQHIKLVAKKAGINVEYDGKSIKVQVR